MPNSPLALHSLDAWPGETARPPLRLLDANRGAHGPRPTTAERSVKPAGWMQRLRRALTGR